jgi:uncharacterized Zn-binding protein involved in type VI secretion
MGPLAAKQGDIVQALDIHLIQPPGPLPPVPVPGHIFNGIIDNSISTDVLIEGRGAATLGSTATNTPPHIPLGGSFVIPPTNQATIIMGSSTVFINKKPAARMGDTALTCNDPAPLPVGKVVVPGGRTFIGG